MSIRAKIRVPFFFNVDLTHIVDLSRVYLIPCLFFSVYVNIGEGTSVFVKLHTVLKLFKAASSLVFTSDTLILISFYLRG